MTLKSPKFSAHDIFAALRLKFFGVLATRLPHPDLIGTSSSVVQIVRPRPITLLTSAATFLSALPV